jgi:multiple sugar transport system permease protein
MSIIGKVGRKSPRMRILNAGIHLILFVGALTMLYPFLLMISSSLKSAVDNTKLSLIPAYLYDDEALYKKYLESRYNEESSRLMDNYPGQWIAFSEVTLPQNINKKTAADWDAFIKSTKKRDDVYGYYVAEHYGRGVYPLAQRLYRRELRRENQNSLIRFNEHYGTGAQSWEEIVVEEKDILGRNFMSSDTGYLGRFQRYKLQTPLWMRTYVNLDGAYVNAELYPAYGGDLQALNKAMQTNYTNWDEIRLSRNCPPPGDPMRESWVHYTKDVLNIHHLSVQPSAQAAFQAMLQEKYAGIDLLNKTWHSSYPDFKAVEIPQVIPDSGARVDDLSMFVNKYALPEDILVLSLTDDYRRYLSAIYGSVEALNQAWNTAYPDFTDIPFPAVEQDYSAFSSRKSAIRNEFIKRNYAMALDQMLSDAHSLRNTGIYVLLSILLAISVNPLAAYALSRFKPRFSYQLIMLFMLTMAFPAMVMGIPNFLMLKRLNLLNTFGALVLPAAADGYFIFLLKGFFDSLPREVYESARIDGAGEFRLFWQFTLYLSKPILAVIALGAFNAAYRNFLFAFIVCQDQSMWTLMVHIYELMQRASSGVGYAALVIAAIPTLAVFIFFQNIIIKGIVIPMEK